MRANSLKYSELKVNRSEFFNTFITKEKLNKFVEVSGDKNPLHTNEIFAQSLNFEKNIVHGLLTSSLYSKLVGVYLPGRYGVIGKISIDFHNPLYLRQNVKVLGKIISKDNRFKNITISGLITRNDVIISKSEILVNVKK